MLEIWLFSVQSSKENTPNRDRYNAGSFKKTTTTTTTTISLGILRSCGSSTPYSNHFSILASID